MKSRSYYLLKKANLSITKPREAIINYLLKFDEAVSSSVLETALRGICNRSTVYRNLSAMNAADLIHRIQLDGESRYKVHPKHLLNGSNVNHPHFECQNCGRLFCLYDQDICEPELPEGFAAKGINYIIYGYCDACNKIGAASERQ